MRFLSLFLAASCAAASTLSDDDLRALPGPGDDFNIDNGKLLAPILIPRVPGTEGNTKTQHHFVDFFASELPNWKISWQNSTSKTPVTGDEDVPFSNIILRRDPPWTEGKEGDVSRLTLVAHFDTLYEPAGFIGAIDSAAPCAMLMHVARSVEEGLTEKWRKMEEEGDVLDTAEGVQILFLDGEEAFLHWSDTDSLYGARSLAEEWEHTFHASSSTFNTPLQSISLFVLLDLLGSSNPIIPSYFLPTHWAYDKMSKLESRLRELNLLASKPKSNFLPDTPKPANRFGAGGIQDDHIPFMARGVDILHMIPSSFPDVWHNRKGIPDDGEHLDMDTVNDWSIIVTAFVAEWFELGGLIKNNTGEKRDEEHPRTKTEL